MTNTNNSNADMMTANTSTARTVRQMRSRSRRSMSVSVLADARAPHWTQGVAVTPALGVNWISMLSRMSRPIRRLVDTLYEERKPERERDARLDDKETK